MGSGLGPGVLLESARRVFWEVVRASGEGPTSSFGEQPLFIPTSCRNPRRRAFRSPTPTPALPGSLRPLGSADEKKIVTPLIADLNNLYGFGLDPSPSMELGETTQGTDSALGRSVLVGTSHMLRLADELGLDTISLSFPGFRPYESTIANC